MIMAKHTVFVAGAGGIGRAVCLFLREFSEYEVDLFLGDEILGRAIEARDWLLSGDEVKKEGRVDAITMPRNASSSSLDDALASCEVILDCVPGEYAPGIAELARKHNCHYANLTEYVEETKKIEGIAEKATTGFILQTGLAPGFINILARYLFEAFIQEYGVKEVDALSMKVGALSRHAFPPHYYGFTWSPIGVATEYVEDAIVVRDSKKDKRCALAERTTVVIDGITYEEALTSGGAADLPDALTSGVALVKHLDYKTLRHPGHYEWVEKVLDGLSAGSKRERSNALEAKMKQAIPLVEDDYVLVYASVQGQDRDGDLHLREEKYLIKPRLFKGKRLKAIQSSTAAALAESARMLLAGSCHGVVHQSEINTAEFLDGPFVKMVYGDKEKGSTCRVKAA
jgi:saccharopine dehydrogenase-like NADP-dependent oxidoreductase